MNELYELYEGRMEQSLESASDGLPIAPSLETLLPEKDRSRRKPVLTQRTLVMSALAIGLACMTGILARGLVLLIDLMTNLAFYGHISLEHTSPANHHLGVAVIIIPVLGGLVVGIMARYGSKAIRGHGIPEAMEQVLTNESKISPRITILKPLSSAVAIGTGGPFGAEGPIIATGGALGSLFGQLLKTTSAERKILLTAGAAAGMSAIFGTPVSAVLLAIELLLFEFSPVSIIPVALASVTGAAMHILLFGSGPAFPMPTLAVPGDATLAVYVIMGLIVGLVAVGITRLVYAIEDGFEHLPFHWMWGPALGGLVVGIVGYFAPLTLGVGYENIGSLLNTPLTIQVLLVLCVLKFTSWSIALGSGTSGGTLAPLLTIGGAFGALLGMGILFLFPQSGLDVRMAALVGMAAMFAGASRALLASILFALEMTQQPHALLPLLGACTASYLLSFFLMEHSIMTEKIARRGVSIPTTYSADVLDRISVRQVASREVRVLSGTNTLSEVQSWINTHTSGTLQPYFLVVNEAVQLLGVISLQDILTADILPDQAIQDLVRRQPVTIFEDDVLRTAIDTMVKEDVDVLPVVGRRERNRILGVLTHREIFEAHQMRVEEEETFERSISMKRKGIKVILLGRKLLRRAKADWEG